MTDPKPLSTYARIEAHRSTLETRVQVLAQGLREADHGVDAHIKSIAHTDAQRALNEFNAMFPPEAPSNDGIEVVAYKRILDILTDLQIQPSVGLAILGACLVTMTAHIDKHHMMDAMKLREYMRTVADRLITLSVSDPGDMHAIAATIGFGTDLDATVQ